MALFQNFKPQLALIALLIFCFSPLPSAVAKPSEKHINRLIKIGFTQAGRWSLKQEIITFSLDKYAQSQNALYAFVANNQIMYIGKTTQTLTKRMNGYKNPGKTQTTNISSNDKIHTSLKKNIPITIFALTDNGLLKYGGFHINIVAGLEDSLIEVINPLWNKRK